MQEKKIAYILLAAYLAYPFLGLIGAARIFAQLVLGLYIGICAFYFIRVFQYRNNTFSRLLATFIILQVIYYFFSERYQISTWIGTVVDSRTQLKNILFTLLSFFPFYYFGRRKIINDKPLIIAYLLLFIINIGRFYLMRSVTLNIRDVDEDEVVNNSAYMFVVTLPFLFLVVRKSSLLAWCLLAFSLIYILMGAKRGAILTGTVGFILFVFFQVLKRPRKQRWKYALLILTGGAFLSIGIYKYIENNEFLLFRLEDMLEGNASGRDVIYKTLYESWINSETSLQMLFGNGFNATIRVADIQAHNDWLELLTNCGLLGVIIYFLLMVSFAKYTFKHRQAQDVLLSVIAIWLMKSMFSMGYTDSSMVPCLLLLGYTMGTAESRSARLPESIRPE